jgi:pimeloyl-ACP methyl ester carboxylesterase
VAPRVVHAQVRVGALDLHVQLVRVRPDGAPPAPALVFLHDSLGCVATWRDVPAALAEATGLDAITYDRRGHGRSSPFAPAPRTVDYFDAEVVTLRRLLDTLGVAEAVLVGHSDGGTIALMAAAIEGERVRAVVSEAAHVFIEDETLAGIRAARDGAESAGLFDRLARYHGSKVPALVSAWWDTWLDPAFRHWNMEALLPRIACPVQVVQGALDEFGTRAQVDAIARGVRGASEVLWLAGCGHVPHREARDAVLPAIAAFVRAAVAPPPRD